jgi:hypothetical protein
MSAPSTRIFMLPVALAAPGRLQEVLQRCEAEFPHRFVQLAAFLSEQIDAGRDMVLLDLPQRWTPIAPWFEQVVEESLGKDGRGLLVFHDQDLGSAPSWPDRFSVLRIDEGSGTEIPGRPAIELSLGQPDDEVSRLATCARFFAGSNLMVALLGYLQDITFAGQPAVESYKAYARRLRDASGPLPYPPEPVTGAAIASAIRSLEKAGRLGYFDLTVNGDAAGPLWDAAKRSGRRFGNEVLRRPTKIRSGPRDYHSTEQSETAGPPDLFSLRVLVDDPEPVTAGDYNPRFLHAQALGTLLAMRDAGRAVLLARVRRAGAGAALVRLLDDAAAQLVR